MNVVTSKYTFDEQVLMYEKYDDLLHSITETINKYYDFRAKIIWGTIAYVSGTVSIITMLMSFNYARQYLYTSMRLTAVCVLLSLFIFVISLLKKEFLYKRYIRLKSFIDSELTDVKIRDGEIRTLRLLERRGYKNIRRVENKGKYCYIYFDNNVYNKPCALDRIYFPQGISTLDLSIFDSYCDEIEGRMMQLAESKTLQHIERAIK